LTAFANKLLLDLMFLRCLADGRGANISLHRWVGCVTATQRDRQELVDRKTPSLVLEKPLDRESVKSHVLLLTALDGGKPPRSGNMTIIVNVSDVNDNPPVFSQESYTVSLKENSPAGTTVIQINATDLDEGSNGEVIYSFGNHMEAQIRERFSLNPVTGVIVVTGALDFEECSRYEIDVQASDKGTAALKTDKTVVVNLCCPIYRILIL
uniref:Cadherin domain-containing protein n=1 Tax=Fundulus heteroclitus TaxID=8078 RepID=A0A3Q2U4V1_FUNHE